MKSELKKEMKVFKDRGVICD